MSKITKALERAAQERQAKTEQEQQQAIAVTRTTAKAKRPKPSHGEAKVVFDSRVVTHYDPRSPIAEQYRLLRTNLQSTDAERPAKTILFTSSVQGEGKTMTVLNLAVSLANNEHRQVLLVDADMRRGTMGRYFAHTGTPGLSQYLDNTNGLQLEDVIVPTELSNLTLLPSGPRPKNPAELLESPKCKELLKTLRSQYDYVLIDAPPSMPLADAAVLASRVDGVVLVVQSGKTQRNVVRETHALLQQSQARVLGFVLTHAQYYIPRYGYYKY